MQQLIFHPIQTIPHQVQLNHLNEHGLFVSENEIQHAQIAANNAKHPIRWLSRNNKTNHIDHDFLIDINNNAYAVYYVNGNEPLGQGRFGFVRLAQNIKSGEWLALKLSTDDDQFIQRELAVLSAMEELRLHAIGADKKTVYILMRFISGKRLSNLIKASLTLKPATYLKAAHNAMQALYKLHQRNILHRDIKPSNIMIDLATTRVSLIDFGFADIGTRKNQILVCEGIRMGTAEYMSPEIRIDKKIRPYSEYSDSFALGIALAQWFGFQIVNQANHFAEIKQSPTVKRVFKSEKICERLLDILHQMTHPNIKQRSSLLTAQANILEVFAALTKLTATDTRLALVNLKEYKSLTTDAQYKIKRSLQTFDQVLLISPADEPIHPLAFARLKHSLESEGIFCHDQYATFYHRENLPKQVKEALNNHPWGRLDITDVLSTD